MEIKELVSAKSNIRKDSIYRRAYIYIALIFIFIFIGFFPDYFSRFGKTDLIHHFHAIFAMLWMVLVITQTWLIGHDNVQWHRRLGKLSFVLAPLLVATALDMVHLALGRGTNPLTLGDGRNAPWQVGKMAARLQAATASGEPVLLSVDFQGGHGGGATRKQSETLWANAISFALWQMGVPGFQPRQ